MMRMMVPSLITLLSATGCAPQTAVPPSAAPHECPAQAGPDHKDPPPGVAPHDPSHPDPSHHDGPQREVPQREGSAHGAPEGRAFLLPGVPGAGEPREVRVLVDEPALKLASIVLRGGTVLPTHDSKVPVTILALQGSGVVTAGKERLRLDPTHAVFLAPNVPHSVEPDAGTDLVLLVHHLGRGAEHHHP